MQDALNDLNLVAHEMMADVSKRVVEHSPELSGIVPELPSDFADLAFQLGLATVTTSGLRQATDLQGSGTQSYLLYQVLDLIDRSAFEFDFGWTKAVMWAIEEPESFLHAGLRTRLAEDLLAFASDARRQVFLTTHEPEFQRAADSVWIATRQGATTGFVKETARAAVVTSSRLRITSYQHPLYLSPDRPLVIVEGVTDRTYLEIAAESLDLKPLWTLVSLGDLEDTKAGGDAVLSYLKANVSVLRSRALHAPVIVVRDWEDNDNVVNRFTVALSSHETSRCVRVPTLHSNPQLSTKFVGIERFLPTDVVEAVLVGKVRPQSLSQRYPLFVERVDLEVAKTQLLESLAERDGPGQYLQNYVTWLDDEVRDSIGQAPTRQMMLPF